MQAETVAIRHFVTDGHGCPGAVGVTLKEADLGGQGQIVPFIDCETVDGDVFQVRQGIDANGAVDGPLHAGVGEGHVFDRCGRVSAIDISTLPVR